MYAGEEYGAGGVYATGADVSSNPVKMTGLTTEHAAAIIVLGSLLALIAIRRGFLPTNVGRLSGGLVR